MLLSNKPAFEWINNLIVEIACIRLGNVHVIPVISPELACRFLKEHDSVFSSRPICMSANLVSNGYLTSSFLPMDEQWMKMRRVLASHVLSPTSLQRLRPKTVEEADHLVRYIYSQCINQRGTRVINLRKVTRYYCANVSKKMIFSKRLFVNEDKDEEQIHGFFTLFEYFHSFSISDYLPWQILKNGFAIASKYIDHEVDKRIQIWKDGNKFEQEDILDVLIMLKDTNGNPLLNVKEIKAQILLNLTMKEMLKQPKIMQRGIEEIDTIVGSNRLVQQSALPKLNYMKACIKESFRLHPLAAFNVPHVSISDAIVGEYFIPRGRVMLLSRSGLGRNPRIWEDPSKFEPERHMSSDGGEVVLTDSNYVCCHLVLNDKIVTGIKLGSTITTTFLLGFFKDLIGVYQQTLHTSVILFVTSHFSL
ncbi:unnamed protein product [Withania somnifera]